MNDKKKFSDPLIAADGDRRAYVDFVELETLWLCVTSRCNLECKNCYIEPGPNNDRLQDLNVDDVKPFLNEIKSNDLPTTRIGITGGEPFCNSDTIEIIEHVLKLDFEVLVLTNALAPMMKYKSRLLEIKDNHGDRLQIRLSLDHYSERPHDRERRGGSFKKTFRNCVWLVESGFNASIATRFFQNENAESLYEGFERLFEQNGISFSLDRSNMVIFPK